MVIKLNLAVKTPTADAAAQARLTTVALVTRKAAALKMLLRADANAKAASAVNPKLVRLDAARERIRLLVAARIDNEYVFFVTLYLCKV